MTHPAPGRPLYARLLRLRHIAPSALLCFLFLEGTITVAVLLALAELVTWWAVVALPVAVAAMVKLNDVLAAAPAQLASRTEVSAAQLASRTEVSAAQLASRTEVSAAPRRSPGG